MSNKEFDFTSLRHCMAKVFERAWASERRIGTFERVIRDRIEAEASFARSLSSISELNFPEEGSLTNPFLTVSADLRNQYKVKAELAKSLNTDVLAPIIQFRVDFVRGMRAAQQRWRQEEKLHHLSNARFTRLKVLRGKFLEEYETLIQEREQQTESKPTVGKVNDTLIRLKVFHEKFNAGKSTWIRDRMKYDEVCNSVLKRAQAVDRRRIEVLKECLTKWVIFETSSAVNRNYDVNGLASILDDINAGEDQAAFIRKVLESNPPPSKEPVPDVNTRLLVLSPSNLWREAIIKKVKNNSYIIHYHGFADKYDEEILKVSTRIRYPNTKWIPSASPSPVPNPEIDPSTPRSSPVRLEFFSEEPLKSKSTPSFASHKGSWFKGMLKKNNNTPTTFSGQILEVQCAGTKTVNGLYIERYQSGGGSNRFEMKKDNTIYYFWRSHTGFWKISSDTGTHHERHFYVSIASGADLQDLLRNRKAFEPVDGEGPSPTVDLLRAEKTKRLRVVPTRGQQVSPREDCSLKPIHRPPKNAAPKRKTLCSPGRVQRADKLPREGVQIKKKE